MFELTCIVQDLGSAIKDEFKQLKIKMWKTYQNWIAVVHTLMGKEWTKVTGVLCGRLRLMTLLWCCLLKWVLQSEFMWSAIVSSSSRRTPRSRKMSMEPSLGMISESQSYQCLIDCVDIRTRWTVFSRSRLEDIQVSMPAIVSCMWQVVYVISVMVNQNAKGCNNLGQIHGLQDVEEQA